MSEAGRKLRFAISDVGEMSHETEEYGVTDQTGSAKPIVTGRDESDQKFVMSEEFRYLSRLSTKFFGSEIRVPYD